MEDNGEVCIALWFQMKVSAIMETVLNTTPSKGSIIDRRASFQRDFVGAHSRIINHYFTPDDTMR